MITRATGLLLAVFSSYMIPYLRHAYGFDVWWLTVTNLWLLLGVAAGIAIAITGAFWRD